MYCLSLKEARENRGLSQQDLADLLNVPIETYQEWEELQPFLNLLTLITTAPNEILIEVIKKIEDIERAEAGF